MLWIRLVIALAFQNSKQRLIDFWERTPNIIRSVIVPHAILSITTQSDVCIKVGVCCTTRQVGAWQLLVLTSLELSVHDIVGALELLDHSAQTVHWPWTSNPSLGAHYVLCRMWHRASCHAVITIVAIDDTVASVQHSAKEIKVVQTCSTKYDLCKQVATWQTGQPDQELFSCRYWMARRYTLLSETNVGTMRYPCRSFSVAVRAWPAIADAQSIACRCNAKVVFPRLVVSCMNARLFGKC